MLNKLIQSVFPMSPSSLKEIDRLISRFECKKDEIVIRENQSNSYEYFILSGICRSYLINPEGEDISLSFFVSPSVLSPYTTRVRGGKSLVNFQALTDIQLGAMDAHKFEQLMVDNLEIREFGNTVLRNFIEGQKDTDAYLIYGDDEGNYKVWFSDELRKYIESP